MAISIVPLVVAQIYGVSQDCQSWSFCRDRTIIGAKISGERGMKRLGGHVEVSRSSRTTAVPWALHNTMAAALHSF
jgi:hypothetical protein